MVRTACEDLRIEIVFDKKRIGYDFDINDTIEKIFFDHLPELVKKLDLKQALEVYEGLIKQTLGDQWPPKKRNGMIVEL